MLSLVSAATRRTSPESGLLRDPSVYSAVAEQHCTGYGRNGPHLLPQAGRTNMSNFAQYPPSLRAIVSQRASHANVFLSIADIAREPPSGARERRDASAAG